MDSYKAKVDLLCLEELLPISTIENLKNALKLNFFIKDYSECMMSPI